LIQEIFTAAFITSLVAAAIRIATPLVLVSMGELVSERSGVLNMSLEGIMSVGAFSAYVVALLSGNVLFGFIAALAFGALVGLLVAFTTVTLRANQVVIGLALVFLLTGLVGFLFRAIFGIILIPETIEQLPILRIPFLADIPYIGTMFFEHNIFVYAAFALVPILSFILFKTEFGLKIRAVGEKPEAVDTLGINVETLRYICIIFGGIMAACGGALLSLELGFFREYMVSGRGWIAIAIVIFGNWTPKKALGGALLFGLVDAFQYRIQTIVRIPYMILLTLPYLVVIGALMLVSRRSGAPAALGTAYVRGGKSA
jgi:simple sugar transport system permease protein